MREVGSAKLELVENPKSPRGHVAHVEKLDMFSKAFHCSPDPISIMTLADGLFIDVNEAFCRTTGYKSEEIIDHTSKALGIWTEEEDCTRIRKLLDKCHISGCELG